MILEERESSKKKKMSRKERMPVENVKDLLSKWRKYRKSLQESGNEEEW